LARRIFHTAVAIDVAEQQIAALLPPQWPLSRAVVAANAISKLIDRLGGTDDLVEFRRELLDPFRALGEGEAVKSGAESGARRCSCQHMPVREAKSHEHPSHLLL
jgi:hypothetical protein